LLAHRYFGNRPQFWLDLQSQYDIALIEREKGQEIAKRVRPADVAVRKNAFAT
jgi:plasmid maintenance system antidote protein VapI